MNLCESKDHGCEVGTLQSSATLSTLYAMDSSPQVGPSIDLKELCVTDRDGTKARAMESATDAPRGLDRLNHLACPRSYYAEDSERYAVKDDVVAAVEEIDRIESSDGFEDAAAQIAETVQREPNLTTGFQNTAHLAESLRDVHVRQTDAADDEVEMLIGKRQRLALGSRKIVGRFRDAQVHAKAFVVRHAESLKGLAMTAADIEDALVVRRQSRQTIGNVFRITSDYQFGLVIGGWGHRANSL